MSANTNQMKLDLGNEVPDDIVAMDAVAWLRTLSDESVDLVVTDPAYESLEKHRKKGTTTRLKHSKSSSNDWFSIFPNDRFEDLFRELYRVLAKNRHCYMLCDQETMFVAKPIAEAVGFKFWKPIIWDKMKIGMGYHYRARYELVLFFEKGKRKLNNLGTPDILRHERVRGGYPTEKPVGLLRTLITQSTQPGELVIDPFCGSGSAGVAAVLDGRRFAGCDLKCEAAAAAQDRIDAIDPETDLRNWDIEYGDHCVLERNGIKLSFSRYSGDLILHEEGGRIVELPKIQVADDKTMMQTAVNAAVEWATRRDNDSEATPSKKATSRCSWTWT